MKKMAGELRTFFVVVLFFQISSLVSTCQDKCVCSSEVEFCQKCSYNVNLKENKINYVEEVCCSYDREKINWPEKYINKTMNEITVYNKKPCDSNDVQFAFPELDTRSLILRNNSISKIIINIKAQNLREIDLSQNKLQYIVKGVFNNLTNLKKLLLGKNKIISILEGSFNGLSELESLDLSENNITLLSNVFTPLKNLQHLNLSRNSIEFIHENYFNNCLLHHLDVSHNNLKKVAPGALQFLPNLARLLLTDNPHLGITQLDTQLLVGTGRRLQQIDASRTGLYQVPEAFTHSVRFLSLVGNRISSIRCGDLDSYPLLQSLDFSDNKIVFVEDDSLGRLEMLLFLNINRNLLTSIPKSLPDELKYLSINNNIINNLTIPDLGNLPNLRILLLQNNQINYIQDHVFDDLLSLEMLDLSNNPIQMLSTSTFDGPLSLRDLRLCYLNVSVPQQDGSFPMSSPESIQMLHLQSSPGLARQLLADSAALAALSHLQYLDLRMNNLTEIRNDLLFYLGQLKTLRLHGNSINCSAELWLKDWLYWNKSLNNAENCYYSSSEAKEEESKYNCTFSETFTINESLPPVNLYSTEMINKLLRYYGYLNNKTERVKTKTFTSRSTFNNLTTLKKNNESRIPFEDYLINSSMKTRTINQRRNFNKMTLRDYFNKSAVMRAKPYNKMLLDDFEPSVATTKGATDFSEYIDIRKKFRPRKRLNTPVNIKMKINSGNSTKPVAVLNLTSLAMNDNLSSSEVNSTNMKIEFSPYQATPSYAQYMGTVAVVTLIVMSLILWVSFRLRYRKRRSPIVEETDDQIEVSNISGGVLW